MANEISEEIAKRKDFSSFPVFARCVFAVLTGELARSLTRFGHHLFGFQSQGEFSSLEDPRTIWLDSREFPNS